MPRGNAKQKEPLVVYERPIDAPPIVPYRLPGGGRPDKLTPEIQERICFLIREGNYAETAARCTGLSDRTYYNWIARGEAEEAGKYFQFVQAIKESEAFAEAEAVGEVRRASRNQAQWAAGMTWLERKFPHKWGRQDRSEHTGEIRIKIVRDNESGDQQKG